MSTAKEMRNLTAEQKKYVKAFLDDDVERWAQIMTQEGSVLPPDNETLASMFLLAKMRCQDLNIPTRLEARQKLVDLGVIIPEDHPLKPSEKLSKLKAKVLTPADSKKMLKDNPKIKCFVFVFELEKERNRLLLKMSQELGGQLDGVKSNIRRMELYTLDGVHMRFALETDDINIETTPDETAYRIVMNVS